MSATVVLPSFNPDETMVNVVKGLLKEGLKDIVVVDDGSLNTCKKYFEAVQCLDGVEVLTHTTNKGKGCAMKTAFMYIIEHRHEISGVVTVDGDGQHLPQDIKHSIILMEQERDKIILGVRDFSGSGVPFRSKFGNLLTRGIFWSACGIKIHDTQTGLRAIPFQYLPLMIAVEGDRYEYETNQLLCIKKQNITIQEFVIETVYLDNNQSSHFHPIRDSLKIYEVIFKFIASSLCSFLVDIFLFTVMNLLLAQSFIGADLRLLIATVGARIASSLTNYCLNKRVVFQSKESASNSLGKYYILCICQAMLSYGLVYLFAEVLLHLRGSLFETVVKLVIDMSLFFVSFRIQQKWVF